MTTLESLPLGTRFRSGDNVAVLVYRSHCRARIREEREKIEQFETAEGKVVTIKRRRVYDVSPATEVELL